MSTRSERDRQKAQQEKHQMILSQLLKDEDNKYCVDCDAKGPRWASWNLGIFLCIRCAGIHRNLGVHISKVRSVNLDTWTPEQIAMMQEMGNSRARAVYEANLPDNFRRPQTDSGLEQFIRAKYETKKYIAKEWIPPKPKIQPYVEEAKKEKKKSRPKQTSTIQLAPSSVPSAASNTQKEKPAEPKPVPQQKQAPAIDLLGLDVPVPGASDANNDIFGDFLSSAPAETPAVPNGTANTEHVQNTAPPATSAASDLGDINLFGDSSSSETPGSTSTAGGGQKSKESILALYGSGTQSTAPQQQMYGVPGGMYMMPGQGQQMNMMGMGQQNMMGQQQPNMGQMMGQQNMGQQNMGQQNMGQQNMGNMMGQQQNMPGQQQNMGNMTGQQQNMGNMMGQQQNMMGQQQNVGMQNMMGAQNYAMMGQGTQGMMAGAYNMGMYSMQQQQLNQVQNQMSNLSMGTPQMSAAGGNTGANWGAQQNGQTLSNNLWQ